MTQRSARIWNSVACGALVMVIIGLLLATWMPAIVAGRQKRAAATSQPTSQPISAAPAPAAAE